MMIMLNLPQGKLMVRSAAEWTRRDALAANQLPLETPSLRIRHLVLEDAEAMLVLSNEEPSRTWLPSQVYRDQAHAVSALESLIRAYASPANPTLGPYVLAIEHRLDGTLLGHVGFSPLDDEVEIGFSIAQSHQGRGLATEAIVAATRWAFDSFGLERILGITSAANVASGRALLRAGFVHQENRVMNFQGTGQDVRVYALTRGAAQPSGAAARIR
jgi:RimJ/RimL family protein N-acetyltransferase